jgi:geranylgeranyl pyrophosphate synthase
MNDALLAEEAAQSPINQLLQEHFSTAGLAELLGPDAAALGASVWSRALQGPVAEFVERPGKAFRASLVTRSYELAGGRGVCPERLSLLVEILHAGSLIIDDIEDESTSRRGGPSLHRVHGLPVALNAGNWMYFWALSIIEQLGVESDVELMLYRWTHRTLLRCHHGQGLDLTANVYELRQEELPAVVLATAELKAGALMELSAVLGALAARAAPAVVLELAHFGRGVGVALQMLDDVGGLVSERRCHKGHEDLLHGRPTWPWAWLAEELPKERFAELRRMGASVQDRALHPEHLARLLQSHLSGSGRVRVRRHIQGIFARLEAVIGGAEALADMRAQLQLMEKSYG